MCLGQPEVANATTDWSDTIWTVGESINVTCNDGFFDLNENTDRRTMTCINDGWEELQGCVRGEIVRRTQKETMHSRLLTFYELILAWSVSVVCWR